MVAGLRGKYGKGISGLEITFINVGLEENVDEGLQLWDVWVIAQPPTAAECPYSRPNPLPKRHDGIRFVPSLPTEAPPTARVSGG